MAAATDGPIASPGHYDPMFKVDVFLHAPLREQLGLPADLTVSVLTLCLQLDTLCKQELISSLSHGVDHGKACNTFSDKANVVYKNLQQTLSKVHDSTSVQLFLQESGIEQIFPRVAHYLASPANFSMKLKETHMDSYLTQLSHLHHILALSKQINRDATRQTGHKYTAHQLAVLYQAISSIPSGGKSLSSHKNNIQENFKALKHSIDGISDDEDESLMLEIRNWIVSLTENIIQVIASMPSGMSKEILPVADLLG